ncbi:MAG: TetR/AcrR family transcriptional regulator [Ghiorsea sp.]|nr:TetR/AcrR family transcriptional regulator [Ghiorsea sp.]
MYYSLMIALHTDVRQHILDTAKPIILGKGFSAVGLNELLSAAGVPKGSFYHYFKSKEGFGEALLDHYFLGYHERLSDLLKDSEGSARDRLMAYWHLWLETQSDEGMEGKCLVVKLGGEVSDLSEPMRMALERGTQKVVALIAGSIREGHVDGSIAVWIDAADHALVLYNMWLGATVLSKIRHDASALDAAMTATGLLLKSA